MEQEQFLFFPKREITARKLILLRVEHGARCGGGGPAAAAEATATRRPPLLLQLPSLASRYRCRRAFSKVLSILGGWKRQRRRRKQPFTAAGCSRRSCCRHGQGRGGPVCGCNRHGNECLVWDDASPPPGGSLLLAAGRERGRKSKSVPDMAGRSRGCHCPQRWQCVSVPSLLSIKVWISAGQAATAVVPLSPAIPHHDWWGIMVGDGREWPCHPPP